MTTSENAHLRKTVGKLLRQEAGRDADSKAVAAAALRLYDRLAEQLTPLFGVAGIDALTGRSLHLTRREFPWLEEVRKGGDSDGPFTQARPRLERQDAATAAEAAVATLATLVALLSALIGEGLASRLLQAAWSAQLLRGDEQEEPIR
jgi:hypothetical protein